MRCRFGLTGHCLSGSVTLSQVTTPPLAQFLQPGQGTSDSACQPARGRTFSSFNLLSPCQEAGRRLTGAGAHADPSSVDQTLGHQQSRTHEPCAKLSQTVRDRHHRTWDLQEGTFGRHMIHIRLVRRHPHLHLVKKNTKQTRHLPATAALPAHPPVPTLLGCPAPRPSRRPDRPYLHAAGSRYQPQPIGHCCQPLTRRPGKRGRDSASPNRTGHNYDATLTTNDPSTTSSSHCASLRSCPVLLCPVAGRSALLPISRRKKKKEESTAAPTTFNKRPTSFQQGSRASDRKL
ncbi:hypothetical protein IWX90DRAFT_119019 [Phyllosticta citrichinensis]|uniref:Uncharacterized protein n=1 Tax=Phyllosticta citrichinensis TaxID=1130410 RepID=A0ABR1Y3F7_9PEZI